MTSGRVGVGSSPGLSEGSSPGVGSTTGLSSGFSLGGVSGVHPQMKETATNAARIGLHIKSVSVIVVGGKNLLTNPKFR